MQVAGSTTVCLTAGLQVSVTGFEGCRPFVGLFWNRSEQTWVNPNQRKQERRKKRKVKEDDVFKVILAFGRQ